MKPEGIQELIEAFDRYDGRYKRHEMEEAVALKEEITPLTKWQRSRSGRTKSKS